MLKYTEIQIIAREQQIRQIFVSHTGLPGVGSVCSLYARPCLVQMYLNHTPRHDLFYYSSALVIFDLLTRRGCYFSAEFSGSEQVFLTVNLPYELGNTFWSKVRVGILRTKPADSEILLCPVPLTEVSADFSSLFWHFGHRS